MKAVRRFLLALGWLFLALLFALPFAPLPTAAAQKKTPAAARLAAIKVTGTTGYSDKEILAASGLAMGQIAADGDFKEAVQRLGDSGMFGDVAYLFSTSASGVKLEIQLSDVDPSKLVPARFENFVWFTDSELRTNLQRSVPLFKEMLPLVGSLPGHVAEALQAMLSDKRLPGRVDFLREARDQSGGPLTAIAYRVEEVNIFIHGFEFPGASPAQSALLTTAARRAIGGPYSRSALATVARLDLLPVYWRQGYLKAEFAPASARISTSPAAENDAGSFPEVLVDAIMAVTPGKVYSTSGVDWKGNSAIPATELAPLLHLPIGQPADAERLLEDVKAVTKLYRSRGYMMVRIKPVAQLTDAQITDGQHNDAQPSDAQLKDEKSTVHYEIDVVEGDLYKMGELEITGLNTQAAARMRAAWTLREGQPYDADYPATFRERSGSILPRGERWAVTIHETPNLSDKTVDVEIRFTRQ